MRLFNSLSALILTPLLALPALAIAQSYPTRPVRLLVPAPPGGGTDLLGRMVAHKLTDTLRSQFIIDNRGGASGMIASEIVARADPDGHTLLICFTSHVTNPSLYPKMPYDTVRDFASVAMVGVVPGVYASNAEAQAQVVRVPGALYKGFATLADAEAFVAGGRSVPATGGVKRGREGGGGEGGRGKRRQ